MRSVSGEGREDTSQWSNAPKGRYSTGEWLKPTLNLKTKPVAIGLWTSFVGTSSAEPIRIEIRASITRIGRPQVPEPLFSTRSPISQPEFILRLRSFTELFARKIIDL